VEYKGRAIIKTINRGRRFMEEKYVIKDTIYAKVMNDFFCLKGGL